MVNELKAFKALLSHHPEFIRVEADDYRNQLVAVTAKPETILTYACSEQTYTYAFNGGKGVGETIEEAKTAFEENYQMIMREYELSRLS